MCCLYLVTMRDRNIARALEACHADPPWGFAPRSVRTHPIPRNEIPWRSSRIDSADVRSAGSSSNVAHSDIRMVSALTPRLSRCLRARSDVVRLPISSRSYCAKTPSMFKR